MNRQTRVVTVASLREFFRDSVDAAMSNQQVDAADQTAHYIVNLLTLFARSEALYEETNDGLRIKPLAFMLADALEAESTLERDRALQRLGDVSLFMAGFFAHSFSRRLVDVDYYISMGGSAYSHLSEVMRGNTSIEVFREIYEELAAKFQRFVDVLNEVSEMARVDSDVDVLRLYEIWMRTGSARAAMQLRQRGIVPSVFNVSLKSQ